MQLLLEVGAEIEPNDDSGYTPLMYAMMRNKPEVVALLVTRGASIRDVHAADGAQTGSVAALKALLTSPRWLAMSRTQRIQAERAILHYVKDKTTLDIIRSLVLDMSALICFQYSDGNNALHTAAQFGKAVSLICALIKEGVDPTALNSAGQTPADMARETGHTLQATLLKRAADDKRKRDLRQQSDD